MNIRDQLIRDEGIRLKPYRDLIGKLTIGVGRNLDDKGISNTEALLLLQNDIEDVRRSLEALPVYHTLSLPRRGVLENMAFNLGIAGFLGFKKMLTALEHEQWHRAADEMFDSKWAIQVGPRAHRLAKQMRTDEWV